MLPAPRSSRTCSSSEASPSSVQTGPPRFLPSALALDRGRTLLLAGHPSSTPTLGACPGCRIPWLLLPPQVLPGLSPPKWIPMKDAVRAAVSLAWSALYRARIASPLRSTAAYSPGMLICQQGRSGSMKARVPAHIHASSADISQTFRPRIIILCNTETSPISRVPNMQPRLAVATTAELPSFA